jgi:hypothetical protein
MRKRGVDRVAQPCIDSLGGIDRGRQILGVFVPPDESLRDDFFRVGNKPFWDELSLLRKPLAKLVSDGARG